MPENGISGVSQSNLRVAPKVEIEINHLREYSQNVVSSFSHNKSCGYV